MSLQPDIFIVKNYYIMHCTKHLLFQSYIYYNCIHDQLW